MDSNLRNVLVEEYERTQMNITAYDKKLDGLPQGKVVIKQRNGRDYNYLMYRQGKQVKTDYIKKSDLEKINNMLKRRAAILQQRKSLEIRVKGLAKILKLRKNESIG